MERMGELVFEEGAVSKDEVEELPPLGWARAKVMDFQAALMEVGGGGVEEGSLGEHRGRTYWRSGSFAWRPRGR